MTIAVDIAVAIVALLHGAFLVLEMFLWNKPFGRRVFGLSPELADQTAPLAANQGLYNGFLAAGLVWSLLANPFDHYLKIFFLSCVIIAGVVGAMTVKRAIFWIQAMPAIVALVLVYMAGLQLPPSFY
ncbi:MAG: DUF1304 domain-containing protein [Gammaproteobacteria bacterium]|nr:MAG: DUF1304 domain-containing protein [Gammaproteobacteria bacterium]